MRIIIRIITVFLVVLAALMSGFALLVALGAIPHNVLSAWTYTFYESLGARAIVATGALFVIAVVLLFVMLRPAKAKQAQVLTAYDGSIKISFNAIAEMVKTLAKQYDEILRLRVKPKLQDDGVSVLAVLTLKHHADIKALPTMFKLAVDELLTEQCGVKVIEVEVLIDRVIGKL